MIRIFQKYRKSVLGVVAIAMVMLAMAGFGVNLINPRQEVSAITVNERKFSYQDFNFERKQLEDRYRQMFGKNYSQLMETLKVNINQQTIDKIVADALFEQFAQQAGMFAGDKSVQELIRREMFGGSFNLDQYRMALRNMGISSQAFEESLRTSSLRTQLMQLVRDSTWVSEGEALAAAVIDQTKYAAKYVEIEPAALTANLEDPGDEAIQKYYEDNASDFEVPQRVSYDYALLDPKDFQNLVELSPDDIEFYYTENQDRYMKPLQIKARHIQLNFPEGGDEAAEAAVKTKGEEILSKLQAGEPFDMLASQNSNDVATSLMGGDLGWIASGKMDKAFDQVAFKLKAGELSGLIGTRYGYHIVKVEERRESEPKPLDEVRGEIEAVLRKEEAPAYTANKALELFESWSKSSEPLSAVAAQNQLAVLPTKGLLNSEQDPEGLAGLTAQVLDSVDDKKQVLEVGDKSVLVQVTEFKEPEIQPLAEVREYIVRELKAKEAKIQARELAASIVEKITQDGSALEAVVKDKKLDIKEAKDMTRASLQPPFNEGDLNSALLGSSKAGAVPAKYFESGGKFYVFQTAAVEVPKPEDLEAKAKDAIQSEQSKQADLLADSILRALKAQAKIDIDHSLLAAG
ncbi:MAG: hypothetical protein DCC75_11505 [Proteobacteria bacterium]|nr:MAG: hypothetical protein DCC75_11505 [Pseudomonadota bacterium]